MRKKPADLRVIPRLSALAFDRVLAASVLPDRVWRAIIRRIVAGRLREQSRGGPAVQAARRQTLVDQLRREPIALHADAANAQHYEVPPVFFERVLGPHLKYSAAYWPEDVRTLAEAEEAMLQMTAARAAVGDGQDILELGCGWGSLTLFLAARYPRSRIVAVSNSAPQRGYITAQAARRGLTNVEVITADINDFTLDRRFDRIVSVEMFEHVRNYPALFAKLAEWLQPDGRLFIHVFAHRQFAYPFEVRGATDWMARYFFTGGMMPSDDLFLQVQDRFALEDRWWLNGRHYARTADAWLENMDRQRTAIDEVLAATYGAEQVDLWRARWRLFFMACAEMFGYRDGAEWGVGHYRFRPASTPRSGG